MIFSTKLLQTSRPFFLRLGSILPTPIADTDHRSYPTSIRGTCYGLSAALGKTGAALGTQAFTPIGTVLGKRFTFIVAACCGVVGVALAFFFVQDKGKDRLEKEDEIWRQYLVDQGYGDITMGDGSAGLRDAKVNEETEVLEFAQ